MSWSAAQYGKFEDERTRPARDLVAHIPNESVALAADIGCGPGNSTEVLRGRFPGARLIGLDSSADMIEAARKRMPDVAFEVADLNAWEASGFDVLLANAVLQWAPGHEALLPRLIGKLNAGGSLAVQMPDNRDEPSHRLMREIAAAPRWAGRIAGADKVREPPRGADGYYRLLRQHAAKVDIWRTTYFHPLAGAPAVVEWVKGTGLRPFLDPLSPDERAAYLAAYETALAKAYPIEPDGTLLLPFPRLFFVATR